MTAAALAEELEVSVRTIYRDLEALSAAGVPVYAEAGPNGGCQLVEGYRTRLTGLTAKEAEALFAAGVAGPVGELGLGTVLGAAQLKLLAALPKELADRATLAQQRFHLDAPTWFRGGRNDPHLVVVAAAVWEDRCIDIRYRHPGSKELADRRLEPLGLVLKAGVWYLVARREGDLRTYRVSRIEGVTTSDDTFERPPDFDLSRFWRAAVAEFEAGVPDVDVVVLASDRGMPWLERLERQGNRVIKQREPDGSGWTRCTVAFESQHEAFCDLIQLGADIEVLDPPELRARLRDTVKATAALY